MCNGDAAGLCKFFERYSGDSPHRRQVDDLNVELAESAASSTVPPFQPLG
jgi:hypothetical protein